MQRPLKAYLKPGRLADVLALIQVLALDKSAHRSEAGIQEELQGVPASGAEWREVAREHPEFFRVRQRGDNIVSLTARHVLPKEDDRWPKLSPEFAYKLIQTAIELHDREVKRSEKWNYLIPAIVAALTSVAILLAGAYLRNERPNQAIQPTAGRSTQKIPMIQTPTPAATRAPASGG